MAMALTTLVLVALTALFVWRHLRSSGGEAAAKSMECPRCRRTPGSGSTICPDCGIPLQLYEVVRAERVEGAEDDGEVAKHAVVRADLCVGCGGCVPACPVEGAIRLEGKLAVVDRNLCAAHGLCAEACPVGAIVLGSGEAVHRVEVPELDEGFQSNVPGIYVVGELGGRGLIKNAINEGKVAVENVAALVEAAAREAEEAYDVAIVGSGPAGLSAGLEAHRRGLRYLLLEQGSLADTIRKYPRHKLLLAEPVRVPLYGDLWIADASKESLLEMWETVIRSTGLRVHTDHRLEHVETEPSGLLRLDTTKGPFRAHAVVLALGRRGTPRRLGVEGEEQSKVLYDVVEMEEFRGQDVLVVGGGDSAVESALGLANQPDTRVALSYRSAEFKRVKPRNLEKLEKAVAEGRLELLLSSQVRRIEPHVVQLEIDGEIQRRPNDTVIVRIGGDPPFRFLQELGIRMIRKDVPIASGEASDA